MSRILWVKHDMWHLSGSEFALALGLHYAANGTSEIIPKFILFHFPNHLINWGVVFELSGPVFVFGN